MTPRVRGAAVLAMAGVGVAAVLITATAGASTGNEAEAVSLGANIAALDSLDGAAAGDLLPGQMKALEYFKEPNPESLTLMASRAGARLYGLASKASPTRICFATVGATFAVLCMDRKSVSEGWAVISTLVSAETQGDQTVVFAVVPDDVRSAAVEGQEAVASGNVAAVLKNGRGVKTIRYALRDGSNLVVDFSAEG
ncbi:MAG: hypothetical protein IT200_03980 [Thermoleophilia bacterium]|nr:hypothetical protein [Thermoleophilia bacterium]